MMNDPPKEQTLAVAFSIIEQTPDVELVVGKLCDVLNVDHVAYVMYKQHGAPYVRLTYPASWILRYLQQGYTKIDPITREGTQRTNPFSWSDIKIESTAEASFQADALSHGIGPHGYSVPLNLNGHAGLFSISSSRSDQEWTDFLRTKQADLIQIAGRLHQRVIADLFSE
jgi:LuxR family transcriptional regulator, quorum-sensing system regulator CinR